MEHFLLKAVVVPWHGHFYGPPLPMSALALTLTSQYNYEGHRSDQLASRHENTPSQFRGESHLKPKLSLKMVVNNKYRSHTKCQRTHVQCITW